MKKYLLVAIIALIAMPALAQKLEASASAAFAIGDGANFTKTGFMGEVGFMPSIAPKVRLGGQVGFLYLPGNDVQFDDFIDTAPSQNFISAAAAVRIGLVKGFKVQADLGYAFGVNKTNQFDGIFGIPIENVSGFYYSPKLLYELTNRVLILVAYRGIALDGFDWQIITAGLTLRFI